MSAVVGKCWWASYLPFLIVMGTVSAVSFDCPAFSKLTDDNLLFQDSVQCDVYWTCRRGESKRNVCPDGLVFHPDKPKGEDPCDLMHNIPDRCKGRSELQRAQPGDSHCPRQNGVYPSEVPSECDVFYSCLNGVGSSTRCAEGLHFSEEIGTCVWARESGRTGCGSALQDKKATQKKDDSPTATTTEKPKPLANGFTCPGGALGVHKSLPHPTSCRQYYICLDGVTATEAGCTKGRVFNPDTQQCDSPENVPGCEDFYDEKAKAKNAELAATLGNVLDEKDFSKFLTLLKESGVLNSQEIPQSDIGSRKGGRFGHRRKFGGGRKRPGHRRRPIIARPISDYYDDYANEKDEQIKEEYEDEDTNTIPVVQAEIITPEISSEDHGLRGLFNRKNRVSSLIPRVKPVGNLENIHPAGFPRSSALEGSSGAAQDEGQEVEGQLNRGGRPDVRKSDNRKPEVIFPDPVLSPKDAESLFSILLEKDSGVAPPPMAITTPPTTPTTPTTQNTTSQTREPSRSSFFNRGPPRRPSLLTNLDLAIIGDVPATTTSDPSTPPLNRESHRASKNTSLFRLRDRFSIKVTPSISNPIINTRRGEDDIDEKSDEVKDNIDGQEEVNELKEHEEDEETFTSRPHGQHTVRPIHPIFGVHGRKKKVTEENRKNKEEADEEEKKKEVEEEEELTVNSFAGRKRYLSRSRIPSLGSRARFTRPISAPATDQAFAPETTTELPPNIPSVLITVASHVPALPMGPVIHLTTHMESFFHRSQQKTEKSTINQLETTLRPSATFPTEPAPLVVPTLLAAHQLVNSSSSQEQLFLTNRPHPARTVERLLPRPLTPEATSEVSAVSSSQDPSDTTVSIVDSSRKPPAAPQVPFTSVTSLDHSSALSEASLIQTPTLFSFSPAVPTFNEPVQPQLSLPRHRTDGRNQHLPSRPAFKAISTAPTSPTVSPSVPFTAFNTETFFQNILRESTAFNSRNDSVATSPVHAIRPQVTSAPFTSFQTLSQLEPVLLQDQQNRARQQSISQDESDSNPSLETIRRMVANRVRSQLSSVLQQSENEGDAIEKLREKVHQSQNRNRARG